MGPTTDRALYVILTVPQRARTACRPAAAGLTTARVRTALRNTFDPDARSNVIGFRLARGVYVQQGGPGGAN